MEAAPHRRGDLRPSSPRWRWGSANVSVIDTATKTPPTITRRHTGAIACDIELNLNF
jgi:hypothetical protein